MAHRSRDWNETLAKELKNRDFAKEFILSSLDEGLDLQTVLGKVIRAYGVQEFAKKVKIASSNILRAIDRRHNPTQQTLNRLLKPFGLRLAVTDIESSGKMSANN